LFIFVLVGEAVHTKTEDELTLHEMAESVGLTTAHGRKPAPLCTAPKSGACEGDVGRGEVRVLDVAIACGFKTQQHFARVFRQLCGASPTEYREHFAVPQSDYAFEDGSQDAVTSAATASVSKS